MITDDIYMSESKKKMKKNADINSKPEAIAGENAAPVKDNNCSPFLEIRDENAENFFSDLEVIDEVINDENDSDYKEEESVRKISTDVLPNSSETSNFIEIPGKEIKGAAFTRIVIIGESFLSSYESHWPNDCQVKPYFLYKKNVSISTLYSKICDHPFLKNSKSILIIFALGLHDLAVYSSIKHYKCRKNYSKFKIVSELKYHPRFCLNYISSMVLLKEKIEEDRAVSSLFWYLPSINFRKGIYYARDLWRKQLHRCSCDFPILNEKAVALSLKAISNINRKIFYKNLNETKEGIFEFMPFEIFCKDLSWTWAEKDEPNIQFLISLITHYAFGKEKTDVTDEVAHAGEIYRMSSKLMGRCSFRILVIGDTWMRCIAEEWDFDNKIQPFFYCKDDLTFKDVKNIILSLSGNEELLVLASVPSGELLTVSYFSECNDHAPLLYPVPEKTLLEDPLKYAENLCRKMDLFSKSLNKRRKKCKLAFLTCYPVLFNSCYKTLLETHIVGNEGHSSTQTLVDKHDLSDFDTKMKVCFKKLNEHIYTMNKANDIPSCNINALVSRISLSYPNMFIFPIYFQYKRPHRQVSKKLQDLMNKYIDKLYNTFLLEKVMKATKTNTSPNLMSNSINKKSNNNYSPTLSIDRKVGTKRLSSSQSGDRKLDRESPSNSKSIDRRGDTKSSPNLKSTDRRRDARSPLKSKSTDKNSTTSKFADRKPSAKSLTDSEPIERSRDTKNRLLTSSDRSQVYKADYIKHENEVYNPNKHHKYESYRDTTENEARYPNKLIKNDSYFRDKYIEMEAYYPEKLIEKHALYRDRGIDNEVRYRGESAEYDTYYRDDIKNEVRCHSNLVEAERRFHNRVIENEARYPEKFYEEARYPEKFCEGNVAPSLPYEDKTFTSTFPKYSDHAKGSYDIFNRSSPPYDGKQISSYASHGERISPSSLDRYPPYSSNPNLRNRSLERKITRSQSRERRNATRSRSRERRRITRSRSRDRRIIRSWSREKRRTSRSQSRERKRITRSRSRDRRSQSRRRRRNSRSQSREWRRSKSRDIRRSRSLRREIRQIRSRSIDEPHKRSSREPPRNRSRVREVDYQKGYMSRSRSRSKPKSQLLSSSRSIYKKRTRSPTPNKHSLKAASASESDELARLRDVHEKECAIFRRNPESHPDHNRLKQMWWSVMTSQGFNADETDLSEEWKEFWTEKMKKIFSEEWQKKKGKRLTALGFKSQRGRDISRSRSPPDIKSTKFDFNSRLNRSRLDSNEKSTSKRSSTPDIKNNSSKIADFKKFSRLCVENSESRLDEFMKKYKRNKNDDTSSTSNKELYLSKDESSAVKGSENLMATTSILCHISDRFGSLGKSITTLHEKVRGHLQKKLNPLDCIDEDARILLDLVGEKMKKQLQMPDLSMVQRAITLEAHNNLAAFLKSYQKKDNVPFSLNIDSASRATLGMNVKDMIEYLKYEMESRGHETISKDDLTTIYMKVKSHQMQLVNKKH